jgi:hypothetical protein
MLRMLSANSRSAAPPPWSGKSPSSIALASVFGHL